MNSTIFSWFKSLQGKLIFTTVFPITGFVVIAVLAYQNFNKLDRFIYVANRDMIPNLSAIAEMRQARNKFGFQIFVAMDSHDPKVKKDRIEAAKVAIQEYEAGFKSYFSIPSPPEVADTDKAAQEVYKEYIESLNRIVELVEAGQEESHAEAKKLLLGRV